LDIVYEGVLNDCCGGGWHMTCSVRSVTILNGHHLDHLPLKVTKSATLSEVQRFAEPLM